MRMEHTDDIRHAEIKIGDNIIFCEARFVGWCEVSEGFPEGEEDMYEFKALEAFNSDSLDQVELTEEMKEQAKELAEVAEWW